MLVVDAAPLSISPGLEAFLPSLADGAVLATFIDWRGYPTIHAAAIQSVSSWLMSARRSSTTACADWISSLSFAAIFRRSGRAGSPGIASPRFSMAACLLALDVFETSDCHS